MMECEARTRFTDASSSFCQWLDTLPRVPRIAFIALKGIPAAYRWLGTHKAGSRPAMEDK